MTDRIEAAECACGGVFDEMADNLVYPSFPPQADFKCNKCGMIKRLHKDKWPGIKTDIIGLEGE